MSSSKKEIRVFFSWQSTLEKEHNYKFIGSALRKARNEIEKKHQDIKLVIDQATTNSPGSPGIIETIMKKISLSQIVISDITIIKGTSKKRSAPNPNVIFELGYAVSEIGWSRVIALTNDKYGYSPENLPFDINKQRVSPYNSDNDIKILEKLLFTAIDTIISHAPKTPQELRGVSIEKIKHEKDSKSLESLMNFIHTDSIDMYLNDLPKVMRYDASICWDSFNSLLNASSFNLYDSTAKTILNDIYNDWNTISHSGTYYYHPFMMGTDYIFKSGNGNEIDNKNASEAWDKIQSSAKRMKENFKKLLKRIHDEYPDINITETNDAAWKDILKFRP